MNEWTTVRLDEDTVVKVDRLRDEVRKTHEGRTVSRDSLVRELVRKAVANPEILRSLGIV